MHKRKRGQIHETTGDTKFAIMFSFVVVFALVMAFLVLVYGTWLATLLALAGTLQALAALGFGLLIWNRIRSLESQELLCRARPGP